MKPAPSNRAPATASRCPGCDRYIGPVRRCPYCEIDVELPASMRLLRLVAVVLAGAGLLFLYLMARYAEAPFVRIAEITPRMNYGTVRVAGTVKATPYLSRQRGVVDYLSFLLDDGTGVLRVSADGSAARALMEKERIPRRGRNVEVTGRISARAGGSPRIQVQSAEGISFAPREEG